MKSNEKYYQNGGCKSTLNRICSHRRILQSPHAFSAGVALLTSEEEHLQILSYETELLGKGLQYLFSHWLVGTAWCIWKGPTLRLAALKKKGSEVLAGLIQGFPP